MGGGLPPRARSARERGPAQRGAAVRPGLAHSPRARLPGRGGGRLRRRRRAARLLPLGLCLGIASALAGCDRDSARARAAPRPNLLLVTVDSLRADALGSYGQALHGSPNLDRLAAQGVVFEQHAASSPSSLPALASLLTGKLPFAHGVRSSVGFALPAGERTLAEVFEQQGYRTGAEVGSGLVSAKSGLAQGFGSFRDPDSFAARRLQMVSGGGPGRTLPERSAADVTRLALEFLEAHAQEPFFLWLHYTDPRPLYAPPPEFLERMPDHPYHAEVLYTDEQLGQVLAALERLALRERTLVAVSGVQGEALGEHGEYEHGFYLWQTTLRVPLILSGAGLAPPPRRIAEPVRSADLAPTLLDWLGLPPLLAIQGVSLRPLLEGGALREPLPVYAESLEPLALFGSSPLRSLRVGRFKYLHQLSPQLYDLGDDPGEQRNLAEELPAERDRLRARLVAFAEERRDPAAAAVSIDSAQRAALEALGYAALSAAQDPRIASFELLGPDPAGVAEDLRAFSLALRQLQAGHAREALELFEALRARHPASAPILYGLCAALRGAGRAAEALPLLREGMALAPRGSPFAADLAELLLAQGEPGEAEAVLRRALALDPCSELARAGLAGLLHAGARERERFAALEQAVAQCPESLPLRNLLAHALATSPDASLRDGQRAAALALEVTRADRFHPVYLRTLSAALAELGERDRAREIARQALRVVEARGDAPELAAAYRAQLETLERGERLLE